MHIFGPFLAFYFRVFGQGKKKGAGQVVINCANEGLGGAITYNTKGGSHASPMPILGK